MVSQYVPKVMKEVLFVMVEVISSNRKFRRVRYQEFSFMSGQEEINLM